MILIFSFEHSLYFCGASSWVYRQAVVHEDEEKNIMADRKEYSPDNKAKKTSPQK